jgi:hypothetical protein
MSSPPLASKALLPRHAFLAQVGELGFRGHGAEGGGRLENCERRLTASATAVGRLSSGSTAQNMVCSPVILGSRIPNHALHLLQMSKRVVAISRAHFA